MRMEIELHGCGGLISVDADDEAIPHNGHIAPGLQSGHNRCKPATIHMSVTCPDSSDHG
jgi:hypothetical protein